MVDLSKLSVGLEGSADMLVTEDKLATHVGSGDVAVFASPMMVAVMEAAAAACVAPHLPDGYTSLGMHLDVVHQAPTPLGLTVTATARITAIDGRKITFEVGATDGVEVIGRGTHTRVIVDLARFSARLAAKTPT